MKQLRLLIAILCLAASVVSASAIKRPTEITFLNLEKDGRTFPNEGLYGILCHYDTLGRLNSVQFVCHMILSGSPQQRLYQSAGPNIYDTVPAILSWHENAVTVTGRKPFKGGDYQYTYVLDNGRAVERTGEEYAQKFFYNASGDLTDVIYRYGRNDMSLTSFIRENENTTRVQGQQNDYMPEIFQYRERWKGGNSNLNLYYSYGEKANMTGIDFLLLETMPYDNQIMTLASLDGRHSTKLPVARKQYISRTDLTPPRTYEDVHEYSYELDSDGYPVKITVPQTTYSSYSCVVNIKYGVYPSNNNTGGVNGIENGADNLTVNGRTVSGQEGAVIRAYDLQGRQVASSADGTLTLPDAGVYILRSGATTMKAAVR